MDFHQPGQALAEGAFQMLWVRPVVHYPNPLVSAVLADNDTCEVWSRPVVIEKDQLAHQVRFGSIGGSWGVWGYSRYLVGGIDDLLNRVVRTHEANLTKGTPRGLHRS